MDADGEAVGVDLLRGIDVDVPGRRGRRGVEARVVRRELAAVRVHAARDLARLLVTPADGRKVRLVVHEAAVEEWLDVWALRADVDLAAGGGVLKVLEAIPNKQTSADVRLGS